MSSLRRMLDVLALFNAERPVIDVEGICAELGYAPASAYRYLRELNDFGLLVRLPGGYALGPRIIELDRLMTEHHPLLVASRDLVDRLADQTGLGVLISELHGDAVINIFQHANVERQQLHFGRGRPMPLWRGATGRVILAYLLPRQLRRLYDLHAAQSSVSNLEVGWKEFSKSMLQIRKQGWCMSVGELNAGKTGLAAPIFDERHHVLGSITLIGSSERFEAFNATYLIDQLTDAARQITLCVSGDKEKQIFSQDSDL